MGILIPEDLDLSEISNRSEREVVRALCEQLDDDWLIIPNKRIVGKYRDYELDVIIAHRDHGIADIEVKGHQVQIRQGRWFADNEPMQPQPLEQAMKNAYKLRDEIQGRGAGQLQHVQVQYAVALPNCSKLDPIDSLDFMPEQLILADQLEDMARSVDLLFLNAKRVKLSSDEFDQMVKVICPDINFTHDAAGLAKRTRARLREISAAQTSAMETLDVNRRVFISGKAGTGKTRLAISWAQRAFNNEERVLMVCFNEPLAEEIKSRLPQDENLVVGSFQKVALALPGMTPIEEPDDLNDDDLKDYWDVSVNGHLLRYWPQIESRFDTIIIDEAQDFSPAWIGQLEALLDPEGSRRILMVADIGQDIFDRGFVPPRSEDGWVVGELTQNCRNSLPIARVLRRVLNGATSPQSSPDGHGVDFIQAPDADTGIVATVRDAILDSAGGTKAVIVSSRALRDALRAELGLGTFEERSVKIPCETGRRLKGTEFDTVILVDPHGAMNDTSLYVGISRAVNNLVVIGPVALGVRLGLKPR